MARRDKTRHMGGSNVVEKRGTAMAGTARDSRNPLGGVIPLGSIPRSRARDLIAVAPGWFWEMDESLRLTFISENATRITGYDYSEMIGRTPFEVVDGSNGDAAWQRHHEDLKARRAFRDFRFSFKDKRGRTRHFRIGGNPIFDSNGHFRGYVGSGSDETAEADARLQAERAEALMYSAIEGTVHAIAVFDADDHLVLWNGMLLNIFGLEERELEGGVDYEAFLRSGIDRGLFVAALGIEEEWLVARVDAHREWRGPLEQELSGDRWFLVEERIMADGCCVATWTDISELKKRERSLYEHERRLRTFNEILLSLARSPSFLADDLEAMMDAVSRAAADALQVDKVGIWLFTEDRSEIRAACLYRRGHPPSKHEILGFSATDHPEYFRALEADRTIAVADVRADPRTAHLAVQHLSPFGIVSILDAPIRRGDRLIGIICHDHTVAPRDWSLDEQSFAASLADLLALAIEAHERRVAERELRATEERFAFIARNVPGIVYQRVMSPEGDLRYTYVSSGLRELHGVDPEVAIADPNALIGLIAPEDRPLFYAALSRSALTLERMDLEFRARRTDGQMAWFRTVAQPYRRPNGEIVWEGLVVDIMDLKQTEAQLRRAKDLAERTNHAKSELLANASHELRTPLNAILGFSEILESELWGPLGNQRYRDYARDINASGQHLLSLVDDLLDLSKIESDKSELDETLVDVTRLIGSSLRATKQIADERHLTLRMEAADEQVLLRADERAIKKILSNIVSNAVKFTPEGGIVTVSAALESDQSLAVSVSDTGVGIAKSELERILTPFGRGDSQLARVHKGTGLGLPVVAALIQLHGGALQISSEEGAGTTVALRFPAERVVLREALPPSV